jgi:cytoskeletal protein CcmA (bactofilin family)
MEHLSDARIKELELKTKLVALLKKPHLSLSALVLGGTLIAFGGGVHAPLLPATDSFALFATDTLTLEQGTQVSSGDLGSNGTIALEKDVLVNGDLFANDLSIDKNTVINGSATYNKLQIKKEAQILGTQTNTATLPIANLPAFADLTHDTESRTVTGTTTTLAPGNYRDITLEKDSTLTLSGGIYTLDALEFGDHATLIFIGTTTINIERAFKGGAHVAILPGVHTSPDQLAINYRGVQPITFGTRAFLNGKLLAPEANVIIGAESVLRGQVLAKRITIRKGGVVSRTEEFAAEPDPTKIITDGNTQFPANEIILQLLDGATFADAVTIADGVGGQITGALPELNMYKIEVHTVTGAALQSLVQSIIDAHNPLVSSATLNFIMNTF